jgi:predicted amidohydrolase YtcJ
VTPVKTYLEEKIPLAGGTDTFVIPANRFGRCIISSRDRRSLTASTGAGQRVRREDVLRIYTINNAILTFEEKLKGSIEPGKLAHFVVLSADYLTVPASQIESMTALATYVGGRVVYHDSSWELP